MKTYEYGCRTIAPQLAGQSLSDEVLATFAGRAAAEGWEVTDVFARGHAVTFMVRRPKTLVGTNGEVDPSPLKGTQ